MTDLTQEMLKELLHYNPNTGIFTWLVKTAKRVNIGDVAGSINSAGYIVITIDNKNYRAHRLAFLYMEGKFPEKGSEVDHINHKKIDNQWVNLRIVTHQDNQKNCHMQKNDTEEHSGVYWYKKDKKGVAFISVNGKLKNLGLFDNLEDAIKARKDAEVKYNFHKNHGK